MKSMITTIKALIETILGVYVPIYTDVYDETGTVIGQAVAQGVAGVDWTFVIGGIIFAVTLYCILRMIGGVVTNA